MKELEREYLDGIVQLHCRAWAAGRVETIAFLFRLRDERALDPTDEVPDEEWPTLCRTLQHPNGCGVPFPSTTDAYPPCEAP